MGRSFTDRPTSASGLEGSEAELLARHGIGPEVVRILREALAAQGLSLRGDETA